MKKLLWLSLLGALLASCSATEQQDDGGLPVKGKTMPEFQMSTLDGKLVDSHAQFAGIRESGLFSAREQAALADAEAVTYSDQQPDENHFTALRRYFDDDAIIELTGLIAFQNMSSKFNAALGGEPQGLCLPAKKNSDGG